MIQPRFIGDEGAVVWPHTCICGSNSGRLTDTLKEPAGGRVYLCDRCVSALARLHGFVHGDAIDEARAEQQRLADRVAALEQQVQEAVARQTRVVSVDELIAASKAAPAAEPEGVAA